MTGHVAGAWLGAALAVTAAGGSLAGAIPLRRGGLLLSLLAILVATHWIGRSAGYVATATSAALSAIVVGLQPATALADVGAVGLLALIGAGISAWTRPRRREVTEPARDPRQLKEEFLATVSHELRTPLNAILGWTELLRMPRGLPPQQVSRGLEVIDRNARRQLALVEELLAAADPSVSIDDQQPLDLRALMHSLVETLAQAASEAQVQLREEPAPVAGAADPVWVKGDAAGLRVALRHIVENAIKFTPPGGRVHTQLRQAGDHVLIFVSDTGPGIHPRFADQAFEPFLQQDGSAARPHGGLGLGLTIARKLIERHGGHVDLRSAGDGTTCLITLPAASAT